MMSAIIISGIYMAAIIRQAIFSEIYTLVLKKQRCRPGIEPRVFGLEVEVNIRYIYKKLSSLLLWLPHEKF